MDFKDSVSCLKGVGEKKLNLLNDMGISNIYDLLMCFPRKYNDLSTVKPISRENVDESILISGTIQDIKFNRYKKMLVLDVISGNTIIKITFFNMKYERKFFFNQEYLFYGKLSLFSNKYSMSNPDVYFREDDIKYKILPIYSLPKGINQYEFRKWIDLILEDELLKRDILPESLVKENNIMPFYDAIRNIHFPISKKDYSQSLYRVIFNEFFFLNYSILKFKKRSKRENLIEVKNGIDNISRYMYSLDFELTSGQKKVMKDIIRDLESDHLMNRLLQGDVGSGKTVIAELVMFLMVKSGAQGVFMAPTEVLARQHFESIRDRFNDLGYRVEILTASVSKKKRDEIIEGLSSGEIHICLGTHALIEPDIKFRNLGIAIIDEQHRFGVDQRRRLISKGKSTHTLVMTATPIPRTLATTLYGDMDISIIDTMPIGRMPVETKVFKESELEICYSNIKKELEKKHQAYVICPLIEDSEYIEAKSINSVYEELKGVFKGFNIALMSGKLSLDEKDLIMKDFIGGKIDILISTTVVEVGINNINATVILIENAERFGLAQLHQLRGRVGRSDFKSYCFLLDSGDGFDSKRLKVLEDSHDGFYIADMDLRFRGAGDRAGTRQHGKSNISLDKIQRYSSIMEDAKRVVLENYDSYEKHMKGLEDKIPLGFDWVGVI